MMENESSYLLERFKECGSVSTDSRDIVSRTSSGCQVIFFGLRGATFDGNQCAASALSSGASYVVVDDPSVVPEGDSRYILVRDSLSALQQLALDYRRSLPVKILAITGSNGKTTTKELTSRVLSRKYRVYATEGNLNNHIGVPLSLLRMPSDTEIGVIEMGANHQGEIARLCEIAAPDYGIVTNIGKAHLGEFGGESGIRKGKGELYDYLRSHQGTAFYLSDSAALSSMISERPGLKRVSFSIRELNDIQYGLGKRLRMYYEGYSQPVESSLSGVYNKYNILSAIRIGLWFGVPFSAIAEAIASFVPDNNRSQFVVTERNRLVLDVYNANPSSMEESLEAFLQDPSVPKSVILGDMKELGRYSREEHQGIVRKLLSVPDLDIWLIGPEFASCRELDREGRILFFPDTSACCVYLQDFPLQQRNILLKGSHSVHLERLLPYL